MSTSHNHHLNFTYTCRIGLLELLLLALIWSHTIGSIIGTVPIDHGEKGIPLLADCTLTLHLGLSSLMLSVGLLSSLRRLSSMTMRRCLSMLKSLLVHHRVLVGVLLSLSLARNLTLRKSIRHRLGLTLA